MNAILEILGETFKHPLRTTEVSIRKRADPGWRGSENKNVGTTIISRNFKLIFIAILAITVFAFIGQFWIIMAAKVDPPTHVVALVDYLRTIATAGFSAILGMIGRKAA